mmetsp:Transcript_47043/g.132692  ORF Transcript_47043/g.132692 Transcript_47043/m.132692 type:complete len:268 (-) Transcript_47043:73-876(-)
MREAYEGELREDAVLPNVTRAFSLVQGVFAGAARGSSVEVARGRSASVLKAIQSVLAETQPSFLLNFFSMVALLMFFVAVVWCVLALAARGADHADEWEESICSDSEESEDDGLARELESLASGLPKHVHTCPSKALSTLWQDLAPCYALLLPESNHNDKHLNINLWRHAKLEWWESKEQRDRGKRHKGRIYLLHVQEVRSDPAGDSEHGSAVVVLHRVGSTAGTHEMVFVLAKTEAPKFASTLKKYVAALKAHEKERHIRHKQQAS